MLSTTSAIETLAQGLNAYFETHGYLWKSSESLDSFEPKKPTIYPFCIPPSDLNAYQMPAQCPCLLLALEKWARVSSNKIRLSVSINCVVVDSAELERETAHPDGAGGYRMGTGDAYEQNARALYRAALLLSECVVDAVSLMTHTGENPLSIEVQEFEPPHALLPDYPFATCVVPVTLEIINNGAQDQTFYNLL